VVASLLEVLARWTERYGLDADESRELAFRVSLEVDVPHVAHPPMPAPLARKVGVRTFSAAIRRVLLERLFGGLPAPRAARPAWVQPEPVWYEPPAAAPPLAPRAPVVRRCSVCREVGHRLETCPKNDHRNKTRHRWKVAAYGG